MIVSCWNIRGLNQPAKQTEIAKFIYENNIDILGITETKVRQDNEDLIRRKCFRHWDFVSNSSSVSVGRIWVGWNPDSIHLTVLKITPQLIHVYIEQFDKSLSFEATFIYGYNTGMARKELWSDLISISLSSQSSNHLALGDFNVTLSPEEVSDANFGWNTEIMDFNSTVNKCCLVDLRYNGEQFTWTNRRFGKNDFTQRKLDRALVNQTWIDHFSDSFAHFPAPGISDHSPIVVNINNTKVRKGRAFKFYNYWTKLDHYAENVQTVWDQPFAGTAQFILCQKLRFLKHALKRFGKSTLGKEKLNADRAREALKSVQSSLLQDPSNVDLVEKQKKLSLSFQEAIWIEEEILKQKSTYNG